MKLFLCSHFSSVGSLIKEEIENKKVAFIPTASLREGYTGYVGSARKLFKKLGAIVTEIDISTEAYSTIQSVFEEADTDKIYAEQLANEYAPKDTSKVVALRKLDAKAKLPANVFTYTFGIITALVAGVGMCLSMKVIGSGSTAMFVLGVIVGIIGLLGMGVNYPIYKKLLAQGKQKYAFEIMELAKEISEK